MDADFMLVDADTFEKMWVAGVDATIADNLFRLPSLDHLFALKLHALKSNPGRRDFKDTLDVLALVEANEVDIRSETFRALCRKFGSEEVYTGLLEHSKRGG